MCFKLHPPKICPSKILHYTVIAVDFDIALQGSHKSGLDILISSKISWKIASCKLQDITTWCMLVSQGLNEYLLVTHRQEGADTILVNGFYGLTLLRVGI